MVPLDRNESYWMLDDELVEAVRTTGVHEFSTYPDYVELKGALAKYADVALENILITPGSDAAIEHIARTYVGEGGEAVLPVPTFYGYEAVLDRAQAKVIPIVYKEDMNHFLFPLAETIEAINKNSAKALFLCNPNNPLGCSLSEEDISTLITIARQSDMLFVVDEAYFEFSSSASFLLHLAELPNLIIIRTLSKSFALAGTRVGYVIAAPTIVKELEKCMLPWPITHSSVKAALALLTRADMVQVRRKKVIDARGHLIDALRTFPDIKVYPSETNFVLVRVPNAEKVRDILLTQDIRVALGDSMSHVPKAKMLLKDTLRIAVPSPSDMSAVVAVFSGLFTK